MPLVDIGLAPPLPPSPGAGAGTLAGDLLARLQQRPRALALLHKRRGIWQRYDWAQCAAAAVAFGQALEQRGIGPGEVLAIGGEATPAYYFAVLGALALGAVPLPLDIETPALGAQLAAAQVRHGFVSDEAALHRLSAAATLMLHPLPRPTVPASPEPAATAAWLHARLRGREASSAALWLPADGQAGIGGVRTHALLRAEADECLPARTGEVVLAAFSPGWSPGFAGVLSQWLQAGLILALPEAAGDSVRDRRECGPHWLLLPPQAYASIAAHAEAQIATLPRWQRWLVMAALQAGLGRQTGEGCPLRSLLAERLVLGALRDRLGLARLRGAHVLDGEPNYAARRFWAALGVPLRGDPLTAEISVPAAEAA